MPDHTKGYDDPHSPKAMFEIPRGADCQGARHRIDAGYNREASRSAGSVHPDP
jgi:hypothetical protein